MGKQNGQRALTNAERQAKWRLAHGHKKAASDASRPKRALMVTCIPRGPLDPGEIDKSAGATLALFDRLIRIVGAWLDGLDVATLSPAEGLLAFRQLGPVLESLAILRAKISEQRGIETLAAMRANLGEHARDVTPQAPRPKIEETLELLRSRLNDNKKPKAT
jgi:hypothetical protein